MSYANGTTHYNLPQTVGTDKRDWFDTNQAFEDIDAAIYGAVQSASESASAITTLTTRVSTNETNIADLQTSRTTDEGRISALETLTTQHTTDIAGVKTDLMDMIESTQEASATAAYAHAVGEYFIYNDTLYITTQAIAVGDTIVPNTNCDTRDVGTVLTSLSKKLPSDAVSIIDGATTTGSESKSFTATEDTFVTVGVAVNGTPEAVANQWLYARISITRSGNSHNVGDNEQYNNGTSTVTLYSSASFSGILLAGDTIRLDATTSSNITNITRTYYSNVTLS